ncbi:type VI secretion system-associated protein TagF [Shewanella waksmanii]|uniref:type VI secretion system-associated protein TagF n=1 Tax=Shewanella waksmanii TaxID=213783 RepID=UPI0037361EA9
MSTKSLNPIGYCGKVPSKGDFVQHNLSADFIKSWSEWQQAVVAVSKEQIPQCWLDCYLTSPVWHFALSAGVCSDFAMCGTMIPSVDNVGRHFPFTLAAQHRLSPLAIWHHSADWAPSFQQAILETLEDDCQLEPWLAKLIDRIDFATAPENLHINDQHVDLVKKSWVFQGREGIAADHLLHRYYQQHFGRYSIWWTEGSQWVSPCFIVCEGLPEVSQFVSMLNGQWAERDWNVARVTEKQ